MSLVIQYVNETMCVGVTVIFNHFVLEGQTTRARCARDRQISETSSMRTLGRMLMVPGSAM